MSASPETDTLRGDSKLAPTLIGDKFREGAMASRPRTPERSHAALP